MCKDEVGKEELVVDERDLPDSRLRTGQGIGTYLSRYLPRYIDMRTRCRTVLPNYNVLYGSVLAVCIVLKLELGQPAPYASCKTRCTRQETGHWGSAMGLMSLE